MALSVTITDFTLAGYAVRFTYDPILVGLIKSLPAGSRRWNGLARAWEIDDPWTKNEFVAIATKAGYQVVDLSKRGRASTPPSTSSWAASLFAAVGPQRAEAVYKALSRVLHPDVGGDTRLMQELNEARRKAAA